jgi:hypothetical protein
MGGSGARRTGACIAILALIAGAAIRTQAQGPSARKPMSLVDLAELPRIAGASPQISPDGKTLAYLLTRPIGRPDVSSFSWRQRSAAARRCSSPSVKAVFSPAPSLVARRQDPAVSPRRTGGALSD